MIDTKKRKSAAIITAMGLGSYAGVQGMVQAIVALCRGDMVTGFLIHGVGAPCAPDRVWHACMPAVTLLPDMTFTAIMTMIVSFTIIVWSLVSVHVRYGGLVLIGASLLLVFVGGGFTGPLVGMLGGLSALWAGGRPPRLAFLSGWWPWPLVILLVTYPFGFLFGYLFPELALRLRVLIIGGFDGLLPIVTVLTGWARDGRTA